MKSQRRPDRGFSLIELLIVIAIIGIIAAIAIPNLLQSQKAARQTAALAEVKNLGSAQALYALTKGRGKYGDLSGLMGEALIQKDLASGQKGGYAFSTVPISTEGLAAMYDTTAKPLSIGTFGTGNVSYYSNEANAVYQRDGAEPPTATPQDRIPQDGDLISQ